MLTVGAMSAFMNNIGATAVLLPVVINIANKAKVPPSKLLIPLAFGSLLGGVTTLIGTPPNLLASDALREVGLAPFRLFDYTPMGLIIFFSSISYMVLVGRHLLPAYTSHTHDRDNLTQEYHLRDYLTELHIQAESPLVGKRLIDTRLGEEYDLTIVGVLRQGEPNLGILPGLRLNAGDILLVNGSSEKILQVGKAYQASLLSEIVTDATLRSGESTVAEIVVSQLANFTGQTLRDMDFRDRYGLTVLAIWRGESPILDRLANVRLRMGDTLLVQGRRERIEAIRDDHAFLLLRPPESLPRLKKAPINLLIFVSMITAVGFGWLHIAAAAVLGAVLTILTGCLTMDEGYDAIEWKSVFLIAGMLPMGIALEKTGTARYLSDSIVLLVGGLGPRGVMIGLIVLTTSLTAFMSNAAAAVLVAPIAIQTALGLGVDPHAFVMGVAIAASNSFVTPISHQSCVLVYGAGGYKFTDFTKVGLPLTLLIWLLSAIFLPIFFPL
jgi:di/tricarboxylate transporter